MKLLEGLSEEQQGAVVAFLTDPGSRRLALAGSAVEKAIAVNDWLNAHDVAETATPPQWCRGVRDDRPSGLFL